MSVQNFSSIGLTLVKILAKLESNCQKIIYFLFFRRMLIKTRRFKIFKFGKRYRWSNTRPYHTSENHQNLRTSFEQGRSWLTCNASYIIYDNGQLYIRQYTMNGKRRIRRFTTFVMLVLGLDILSIEDYF